MTSQRVWFAALVVALLGVLGGCKGKNVAEVNGQPITIEEFSSEMESLHGAEVLERMVLQRLILQAAKEKKLEPTQEEVEQELQKLKTNFKSEDAYFRWLKDSGREEADVRRELTSQLTLNKLQTEGIGASDADLQAFFQQNRAYFDQPERLRFHQIIVVTKEDADRVHGRLLEGINFEALAKSDSVERMSGDQGGEVPVLPAEQVRQSQPELYALLKELKPGQASKPTRIRFRNPSNPAQAGEVYAIVRMDEVLPAKQAKFEEVKDQVKQAFMQQKAKQPEAVLQELAAKANLLVYSDRYRAMEGKFGGKPVLGEGLPNANPEGEEGEPASEGQLPPTGAAPGAVPSAPPGSPVLPPSGGE